jgi:putative restriction endonuclease
MAYPFPRLKTDGFWHLLPNPGYENKIDHMEFSSMSRLREVCAGAVLDEELFILMSNPESREVLRSVLIHTYFAPEIRPRLVEQGSVNITAHEYSRNLLAGIQDPHVQWEEAGGQEKVAKVRDQGFRKAIVTLYDHRCALCGIRMITPEGHTVVEAAHIKPWRESQDDCPTNGLSLCRLCHWSFDEGLMSVGTEFEVLVSKRVRTDQNMPGHMLTLTDRPIFRPTEIGFWPAQGKLDWHRRNSFLR